MVTFHNTPDGEFHEGPEATCRWCSIRVGRDELKRAVQRGEIKPQAVNRKFGIRTCDVCGAKINLHNISGLCLQHYREKNKAKSA